MAEILFSFDVSVRSLPVSQTQTTRQLLQNAESYRKKNQIWQANSHVEYGHDAWNFFWKGDLARVRSLTWPLKIQTAETMHSHERLLVIIFFLC